MQSEVTLKASFLVLMRNMSFYLKKKKFLHSRASEVHKKAHKNVNLIFIKGTILNFSFFKHLTSTIQCFITH